jgi:hypothetical protein
MALDIELGDMATFSCACCQRDSATVHGFLYDTSGTTSVYFAGFTHGHPERRANLVLSVGGWGEGTTPADRTAIAPEVYATNGHLAFGFPVAENSPWYGKEFLGRMVSPSELTADERERYQDMAKVVVEKDPRVADYLERG